MTRRRRPPACEWRTPGPHALTYARLYPSGWWCALHTPAARKGRPESPPGPGWPIHRRPPHGTDPEAADPTSTEHRQDETR
ncbi:hypothetical protein [Streptomyces sp. STCH 565 A]|uniref:hypothetical protein n=1 Tax=Streptomyces sp. STCH 565 A TaxID=2950532 RepID=UPI0020753E36|nr:hypothetical protein [Streptomyces sp. STCH 565 A]MCM8548950.1 hypothetical protein [Streptomyces sp. STCH 565 A]